MKSLNINSKKGFTIIEVVLVLAIAGLIFLMVFIALPNMQMSQRNTRRRNDYSALSTQITTYVSNNSGSMPTTVQAKWLNSEGKDPDGNTYKSTVKTCTSTTTNCDVSVCTTANTSCTNKQVSRNAEGSSYQVMIIKAAECNGAKPKYKNGERNFVVYGYIETVTGSITANDSYCLASHG